MNKVLLVRVGLAVAVAWMALLASRAGQAQQPGAQVPESFVIPVGKPGPSPTQPAYLPTTPGFQKLPQPPQTAPDSAGSPSRPTGYSVPRIAANTEIASLLSEYARNEPDCNADIAVQPSCGDWMISVIEYSGKDAPMQARAMVKELRSNPAFRLNAYVFTRGLEERNAELKNIEAQVQFLQKMSEEYKLSADAPVRIQVTRSRLELHCAVLVGGYKDMQSAGRVLKEIRDQKKSLDPAKVKLQSVFEYKVDEKGQFKEGKDIPINPFNEAMVVWNPSKKPAARANEISAEDMALFRSLNSNEAYSLLKNPKKYTLKVKTFSLGVEIQPQNSSGSMFGRPAPVKAGNEDQAAVSAHNLAELLRKGKWEAYVLHTKYCSYVTVGSYDDPNEPGLKRDQETLPKLNQQLHDAIKLLPCPVVMAVPKPSGQ